MLDPFSNPDEAQNSGSAASSRRDLHHSRFKRFKPNFLSAWIVTVAAALLSTVMAYQFAPRTADPNPTLGFVHVYVLLMVAHFWWLTCLTKFKQVQELGAEQKIAYQWLATSYLAVMTTQFALLDRSSSAREMGVRSAFIVLLSGVGWCFMIWSILRSHAAAKADHQRKSPFDD